LRDLAACYTAGKKKQKKPVLGVSTGYAGRYTTQYWLGSRSNDGDFGGFTPILWGNIPLGGI
jgi:hypothetical protein